MSRIETFEELKVWQKAKEIALSVYELTKSEIFSKDYALKDQARRSAISVMSNIAEGFERKGNKEFLQFLFIASGSLGELKSQLILAHAIQYINELQHQTISSEILTLKKMMGGLITHLKNSDYKGAKYVREPGITYNTAIDINSIDEYNTIEPLNY